MTHKHDVHVSVARIFLLEGPLIAPRKEDSSVMIFSMAADLIEADAFRDHRISFHTLVLRGYNSFYVSSLIDDARQVAMQSVVAAEMSKP
jgi:hypothetical protein